MELCIRRHRHGEYLSFLHQNIRPLMALRFSGILTNWGAYGFPETMVFGRTGLIGALEMKVIDTLWNAWFVTAIVAVELHVRLLLPICNVMLAIHTNSHTHTYIHAAAFVSARKRLVTIDANYCNCAAVVLGLCHH